MKNGRARRRHARGEGAPSPLAGARSLFRPLLPSVCYAGYVFCVNSICALCFTINVCPPPTPPKNIANHGELKESHFEMSHSISPANNQGPPTTVSSLINFIQIHSCMSVCFPCWRRCLRCAKRCSLFRGCLLRSAHRWILIGVLQRSFNGKSFSARICRHLLCLQFCVISMGNCSWFADGKHCLTDGQVYVVWKHTCSLTSLADTKGIFMKR